MTLVYTLHELIGCDFSKGGNTCPPFSDLKSKNVLLSDTGVAKICDVGLAKVHDNGYATQDSMIGTFAWAAPELLMGQKYGGCGCPPRACATMHTCANSTPA